MKKFLAIIVSATLLFSACNKYEDRAFSESPDVRLNKALADYQSKLVAAPYGWKTIIVTDSGKASSFFFYFKFNNENRVSMLSEFDMTLEESSYRLKATQRPALIFDTYSKLHILSDPDPDVAGGEIGEGFKADFEFEFESASADTIKLTGVTFGTKALMIRATEAEEQSYINDADKIYDFENINKIETYFKRATIGGVEYEVNASIDNKIAIFTWQDGGGAYKTHKTNFVFVPSGILLQDPVVNGSTTISSFSDANWDAGTKTFTATINGVATTFVMADKPMVVDLTAGRRWWEFPLADDGYWASWDMFYLNGVRDGYNVNNLSGYYYWLIWPNYEPGTYDLFAPVFEDGFGGLTLRYGATTNLPNFGADGITKFPVRGNLGTYPASGPARLTRTQFISPDGYYFVQISETAYDMVSAKDARAWVYWFY